MRTLRVLFLVPLVGLVASLPGASSQAGDRTRPFVAADLKVEINATEGDAGLQIFLDDDAWNQITIVNPAGNTMLDVEAKGPLENFGLTELFSESNEPPFTEFPLEQFQQLFPEGNYTFTGTLIDGTKLRSEVPLTHDFPTGPTIVQPEEDAEVPIDNVVVRWQPGEPRPGVTIVGYQVVVTKEEDTKVLSADLPPSARQFPVPPAFLQPQTEYKVEVLEIETSGNQTLNEVTFTVNSGHPVGPVQAGGGGTTETK